MGNVQDGEEDPDSKEQTTTGNARGRQKTFNMKKGTARFEKGLTLKANLMATLGGQLDMKEAVKLPEEEELNEWLAINTFLFFEIATNVYSTVETMCTDEACPTMTAGPKFTYLWADGKKVKKPIECTAPQYVDYLFDWISDQISDPDLFPQDDDAPFPKNFKRVVKQIFKRLFRLYAHIFHSHFQELQDQGVEAHLNSSFKHVMYFILEFDLVPQQELMPLKNLILVLLEKTEADI